MTRFASQYERPLAAKPLTSYRYIGPYGGIAIGAMNDDGALREAARALSSGEQPEAAKLERWDGEQWVRCA